MNTLKNTRQKLARAKAFYVLAAAHSLDKAIISSHCANHQNTLEHAQDISDQINFFWKAETTPYHFMKPIDETVNKSIEQFTIYQNAVNNYPFEKRAIESFCKWFVNTGWDASMIKCNMNYILYGGLAIQEFEKGKIDNKELSDSINAVIDAGQRFFTYKSMRVLRAFTQATNKLIEIENKIESRNSFTGIPCK